MTDIDVFLAVLDLCQVPYDVRTLRATGHRHVVYCGGDVPAFWQHSFDADGAMVY